MSVSLVSIDEMNKILGCSDLTISSIINGCKMSNKKYFGRGNIFVNRSFSDDELDAVAKIVTQSTWNSSNIIVIYNNLQKNHNKFSYYNIVAVEGDDILSIKTMIRINNMKAFL